MNGNVSKGHLHVQQTKFFTDGHQASCDTQEDFIYAKLAEHFGVGLSRYNILQAVERDMQTII